jgi:predicted ATPase with chaperone activity
MALEISGFILNIARRCTAPLADLAGVIDIGRAHLAEAIQYRPRRVE